MELMSTLMSIEDEKVLVVLLYRPPVTSQQQIRTFIDELTYQLAELHTDQYNTIILGDFNLEMIVDIDAFDINGVSTSYTNKTLSISYNPAAGTKYKDLDLLRFKYCKQNILYHIIMNSNIYTIYI